MGLACFQRYLVVSCNCNVVGRFYLRVLQYCSVNKIEEKFLINYCTNSIFKMNKTALNTDELLFEEKSLYVPELNEIKDVIQGALLKNFECVNVEVTECPNLTAPQYGLMDSGLGGSPLLLELGGPPYLLPTVQRSKLYDIKEISQKCLPDAKKILAMGAGAGPHPLRNSNCEGIFNLSVAADGTVKNGSYTAKVSGPKEECVLERIPNDEHRCALLLNLFVCRGECGKVIKINCKKRCGSLNFIESIRLGLENKYKEKCVGMGGIFLIKKGNVHQHVMRDFSKTPLNSEEELNNWLKFYNMPAQLNAVGTLITHENDLDLRLQHFHSFSNSNWGGHYHYDTTPDIVEYEAYLNVAERVVRVDKPVDTHKFGRD
ncbi:ester hydrolase C11orf54 homolog [Teleopsis dalmanni]|uniref:ester hydrolase C11orf54 homolog n=1 Tax=Teleopsis dalmanni TaxID=139649 RepID=UPI000D32CBF7|nr:ester hydrolase C11orf54 homolog [Teleopsis dalmanni]